MTHRTMAERIERSRQRATRRETLLILLNRADRLSAAEATRLAEHARAELAEADELRRTVQGQQRAMQDAITRTRAAEAAIVEVEAERDQARGAIRSALPDLRRAIDCLDATCRYHGDRLDPDEYGRRYRAEACCDTGVEPRRAREARQTLDRLSAALDEHQEQT